ncbi:hypothetical protein GCM10010174_69330 [Kutzneria viridogrisea]|uniref:Uncharacterized protein n=2 Tax=Kutzneria TaxID=43356 RepID=W5WBX4_9PSEU|nr:hypothetical protein [Kutzneria albida]AHH98407.1 hypothetical protein KALB_5045 [Kutzneria albida DSM 43870]MBA8924073.1 hypothetical protein [Kutzneria viridogrisea]
MDTTGLLVQSPPHLRQAERLIDHLVPANNVYKRPEERNVVKWGREGRPASWVNRSQCASFITAVLRRSHPWARRSFFTAHFDSTSPYAKDYLRAFNQGDVPHFTQVERVTELRPGDLIAIEYPEQHEVHTGHVVMVRELLGEYVAANEALNLPGSTQYAVSIADCTAEPHGQYGVGQYDAYPDSRIVDADTQHSGAGYGHMMFYADNATGRFSGYRWSVNSAAATIHPVTERPIAAARVLD